MMTSRREVWRRVLTCKDDIQLMDKIIGPVHSSYEQTSIVMIEQSFSEFLHSGKLT